MIKKYIYKMENFKKFYNIEKEITLQSTVESSHLYVFYNDQWSRLTRENPQKFYSLSTLQSKYKSKFLIKLGLPTRKGEKKKKKKKLFSRKLYEKQRISLQSFKKYYAKQTNKQTNYDAEKKRQMKEVAMNEVAFKCFTYKSKYAQQQQKKKYKKMAKLLQDARQQVMQSIATLQGTGEALSRYLEQNISVH